MDSLDERVAHLEGRAMEQSLILASLSREVAELRRDMHARFASMDQRMSTQFFWLVGIMVSGGLTLLTAVLTAILRH